MAPKESSAVADSEAVAANGKPRSLAIAEAGVTTGASFALMMSALIADIAGGRVTPIEANAICNAGGKLLKVVELGFKYGSPSPDGSRRLSLVSGTSAQ